MKFNPADYEDLLVSPEFAIYATENPSMIERSVNGVGSTVGWFNRLTFHLIPETIYGLNIRPCADIHDFDYQFPSLFSTRKEAWEWKKESDTRFGRNICRMIRKHTKFRWLKCLRYRRARKYVWAVRNCGASSFFDGKIILEDLRHG